jgi:superfamily II DNA/RNA helicase
VLVACPGRLEDHIRNKHVNLDAVEVTVLDEADHMADLGFLPAVERLLSQTPRNSQRLLFSATLDRGVDGLVRRFLHSPITHSTDSVTQAPPKMEHHVLHVRHDDRLAVLIELAAAPGRTLVFTRTKHRAKRLTRDLLDAGIAAVELHGNLAQNARERNLSAFAEGAATTLVATDIAARGIHVDDIALVVHADPPVEHKAYLHRSGRTARAGASGTVITLMTDDQVADVRSLTRKAAITPTTTRARPGDSVLSVLAPGARVYLPKRDRAAHVDRADTVAASRPRSGGPRRPQRSNRPAAPAQNSSRGGRPSARTGGPAAFSKGARPRGRASR